MTREEEIQKAAEEYATGSPQATLRYKAFKDGAKYADAHPAKKQAVTIEAWVARDRSEEGIGFLGLYRKEPTYLSDIGWNGGFILPLDRRAFSDITLENSPQKVKVTIEMEEEK